MAMLEIKDLEVYYGVICAIKGISFEVNQGEVIALIGANGAGKTTILHTITGLIPAKSGSIKLLRTQGIKTVKIVGFDEEEDIEEDLSDDEVKNQHIEYALSELNDIFESNEIRELSHEAVKKVDSIADDILSDLKNNSTYLGNQMIALQNYDDYTYKHCLRVSMLSTSICYEMGFTAEQTKEVIISALLHDIGKSNIDHDIIIKPGKLTDEEFEEIKRHPIIGYDVLKNSGCYSPNIMAGVLFHQEKFDGTGYPRGLKGYQIPLIARIIAVADVFDALTSNRPYRKPWSVAETEEYMLGSCVTHFDYDVVAAFLRAFNPYPVGTMVSLSDNTHGVVISHNTNVLRPVVLNMGVDRNGRMVDLANDFKYLSLMITGIYNGDYSN